MRLTVPDYLAALVRDGDGERTGYPPAVVHVDDRYQIVAVSEDRAFSPLAGLRTPPRAELKKAAHFGNVGPTRQNGRVEHGEEKSLRKTEG